MVRLPFRSVFSVLVGRRLTIVESEGRIDQRPVPSGAVWDDDEEAHIRVIEGGALDADVPSRRHRRRILAVDRERDVAAVLVAVRGKRRGRSETVLLYRHDGDSWAWCGSGGNSDSEPRIPDRSTVGPTAIEVGGRRSSGGGPFSRPVCAATVRAGAVIAALEWRGMARPILPSGFAVVVWRGRKAPTVVGLDVDGNAVAEVALALKGSPLGRRPLAARVAWALARRRHSDGWFNYTRGAEPPPRFALRDRGQEVAQTGLFRKRNKRADTWKRSGLPNSGAAR